MLKSVRFGFMLLDSIQQFFFKLLNASRKVFKQIFFFAVICLFLKKGKDVMY